MEHRNVDKTLRTIRSFVIRGGRMTKSQRQALDKHMAQWGLTPTVSTPDYSDIFQNKHPVIVEIGFGMGDSLAQMAEENPALNFIGIEVHQPGVGRLLSLVEQKRLKNIRVYNEDAVQILHNCVGNHSLDRINIYFPDPWHKKKHHKRRLIQSDFLELIYSRLAGNGILHVATDWQPYAEHILELLQKYPQFENVAGDAVYVSPEQYGRPTTKFEQRGKRLGHGVWDMVFRTRANV